MYFNPNIIIKKIKENLNESYYNINNFINKASVNLKEKDIKFFLEEKYLENRPNDKNRLQKLENKQFCGMRNSDEFIEYFSLKLEYGKYKYEPYTLEYFKKYSDILKKKCTNLIKIIDGIIEETISKDILNELDINLDENGNILMSDVLRLTEPFVYNYNKLKEIIKKANDLNTYLEFKMSLDEVYRNGLSEQELYPSEELQDKHYEMQLKNNEGYIPLTEKQKKLMKTIDEEYIKSMCDLINKI